MRADWWNTYVDDLRVPFAEKGRSLEGWDCWGLVQVIYDRELGIKLPSYLEHYETTNDRDALGILIADERDAKWIDIAPADAKPFDVIVLNMRGVPMHVGLVTKARHMVHCAKGVGTTHEPFTSIRWKNKVIGFGRYEQSTRDLRRTPSL